MVIIDSKRDSASRGVLACSVPIEPSWPVFIACSKSNASGPRTSPTMMRSGRMRRQLRTRSRIVICPSPSRFGGLFASGDALGVVDVARQAIEQRGLARTGTAGDQGIDPRSADDFQDFRAFRRNRTVSDKLLQRQLILLELADGEAWTIDRQRRPDRIDARAVRRARIADLGRFVHAAADLADDPLADVQKLLIIAKPYSRL